MVTVSNVSSLDMDPQLWRSKPLTVTLLTHRPHAYYPILSDSPTQLGNVTPVQDLRTEVWLCCAHFSMIISSSALFHKVSGRAKKDSNPSEDSRNHT